MAKSLNRLRSNSDIFNGKTQRPSLLDGASGTYLAQKGFAPHPSLWYSHLNIYDPESVKEMHSQYINAGAVIITTNTFRTNPEAVKKTNTGFTNYEIVKKSVEIAYGSIGENEIIIAGSNAPAEDCYQQLRTISLYELEYNHKKHIEMLWNAGVDFILNETQSHRDEIEIVCKFCCENNLPFVVSLYFDKNLKILSGEDLREIIELIKGYKPLAISFNCISPQTLQTALAKIEIEYPSGFYLNCGLNEITENIISSCMEPDTYAETVRHLIRPETVFLGSCCGSSPHHTAKLKDLLDELY